MEEKESKRYFWLKLNTTYFSQIEQKKMKKQEDGKEMQLVYLRMMLLSIGRGGYIYYQGVYDTLEEELAEEFDEPVEIVKKTLEYLKANNIVSFKDSRCYVPEAVKLTGSEGYSAERMRRYREKHKTSQSDAGVTQSDEEKEIDIEIEKELEIEHRIYYQHIADMYNEICISFPKVTNLSDKRKQAIKARLKKYSIEDIKRAFEIAEGSSFLKGGNNRNWSANFDWMMKDANIAKILDGNYSERKELPVQEEHHGVDPEFREIVRSYKPSPDDPFQ